MAKPILTLTENAIGRAKQLMGSADGRMEALRVKITSTGCSGHAYKIEYAEDKQPGEEVIEQDGVRVYIDPKAIMFILGSEMDYEEDVLQSQFVFNNPNEASRCGCGESFQLKSETAE
jgi:iron-sulfur cluster assembly protein